MSLTPPAVMLSLESLQVFWPRERSALGYHFLPMITHASWVYLHKFVNLERTVTCSHNAQPMKIGGYYEISTRQDDICVRAP